MLTTIKSTVDKTKKFVEKHPTLSACVVTAAVSWKISHDVTLSGALSETTSMAYNWGAENGLLKAQNDVFFAFITERDLTEDLSEFMSDLKD
jgi:hypothetical protein